MTWAELRPAFAKRRYPCAERASAHGLIARNNHLVENAVKHGICRREEGGTLIISTKEYGDYIEVRVSDDGVGFDPEQEKNDGKPHVGIKNVKKRLYTICHGTLIVNSKPGEGTTIIMRLPKENKE